MDTERRAHKTFAICQDEKLCRQSLFVAVVVGVVLAVAGAPIPPTSRQLLPRPHCVQRNSLTLS